MLHRLRIAASVFFTVTCVALCVLWVRSFRLRDEANYSYWPNRLVEVVSIRGTLELRDGPPAGSWKRRFHSDWIEEWEKNLNGSHFGFVSGFREVTVPHWILVLCAGILAAAFATPYSYHTSLRTLLVKSNDASGSIFPRLNFSLRTLLLFMFVFALLLWGGRATYNFWRATPTVAISDAVSQFNASAVEDRFELQPPLSAEEILSSIQAQLPRLNSNPERKAMYEQILKTGRLPVGARLVWLHSNEVSLIELYVPGGNGRRADLRIRETNNPVIGQTP
jgi:hypothetical protein